MSGRSSRRLDAAFGGWRPQGKPVPSCEMSVAISPAISTVVRELGVACLQMSNNARVYRMRVAMMDARRLDAPEQGAELGVRLIACRQSGWGCRQAFATTRRVLLNDRGRGMPPRRAPWLRRSRGPVPAWSRSGRPGARTGIPRRPSMRRRSTRLKAARRWRRARPRYCRPCGRWSRWRCGRGRCGGAGRGDQAEFWVGGDGPGVLSEGWDCMTSSGSAWSPLCLGSSLGTCGDKRT